MKVAIIQITSTLDPEENMKKINHYTELAVNEGAEVICLPEVFYSMSDGTKATPFLVEEGEHMNKIKSIAINFGVSLIGGTVAFKQGDHVLNRALNFNSKGSDLGVYDKTHLFKVSIGETNLNEGNVYTAGTELCDFKLNEFHMGISTCFDLRFPEIYRSYFTKGVNVMTVASAFTVPTGRAHWETLIRARAIENQSYIIAANQTGQNNKIISTYGHSMVVNPWGEVIASLGSEEGYAVAELSLDEVVKVRKRMDVSPRSNISLI